MHIANDFSKNTEKTGKIFIKTFPQIENIIINRKSKCIKVKINTSFSTESTNIQSLCNVFNLFIIPFFVLNKDSFQKQHCDQHNKSLNISTTIKNILDQITLSFKNETCTPIKIKGTEIIQLFQGEKLLLAYVNQDILRKKLIPGVTEYGIQVNDASINCINIETTLKDVAKLESCLNHFKESYKEVVENSIEMGFIYYNNNISIALYSKTEDKGLLSKIEQDVYTEKRIKIAKIPNIKALFKVKSLIKDIALQHTPDTSSQSDESTENTKKSQTNQLNKSVKESSAKHTKKPTRKIIKNSKRVHFSLKKDSNKSLNTNLKIKTLKNILCNKVCIFTILTSFALTATVASYFTHFYKYIHAEKRNKIENILIIGGSLLIAVLISGFIANSYLIYRETIKQPKDTLYDLTDNFYPIMLPQQRQKG